MKKYTYLVAIILFLSWFKPTFASTDPPSIDGEACIVMDMLTGKVLYDKEPHKILEPASTTKIMTSILALELGNLKDTVITGDEPPRAEGTRIFLEEGEELTLEQVLYGMMLNSGNDAAIAIAEHISGDVPSFVELMNHKAREIGAFNTHYVNPNGLVDEGHVTTAYDLALIARYAMNSLPKFREIVSTKTLEIPWKAMEQNRNLINLNKLLWEYEGASGIKTGYTSRAGRTLVSSASRGDFELIAVILKSGLDEIWPDAMALLDYGFDNYEPVRLSHKGTVVTTEKAKYAGDLDIVAGQDLRDVIVIEGPEITSEIVIDSPIVAPIVKDDILGKLIFYRGRDVIGSVDLLASDDVKRNLHTYWWVWVLPSLLIIFVILRTRAVIRRKRRYEQYRYLNYQRYRY